MLAPAKGTAVPSRVTQTGRRRGRWLRALVLLFLGLACAGAALCFAVLEYAENTVGTELARQAEARGLTVTWESLHIGLDGRVVIEGVVVTSAEGGIDATIEHVHTQITATEAWNRQRPTAFTLSGVVLSLETGGLRQIRNELAERRTAGATGAPGRALRVNVRDVDVLVREGTRPLIACHAPQAEATLRPRRSLTGVVSCRSPAVGLDTGEATIHASHDLSLAPEPWQVTLTPTGNTAQAGVRFERLLVSMGPEQAHLSAVGLALHAPVTSGPLQGPPEVVLEAASATLARDAEGWRIRRLEVGPGQVTASVDAPDIHSQTAAEPVPEDSTAPDNEEPLPLAEIEAASQAAPLGESEWVDVEARLESLESAISTSMALVTSMADRIEVHRVALSLIVDQDTVVPLTLERLTATPGEARVDLAFAGHDISASIAETPDGLTARMQVAGLDLAQVSRTVGAHGLLSGSMDLDVSVTSGDPFRVELSAHTPDVVFTHLGVSPLPIAALPIHIETDVGFSPHGDERLLINARGRVGDHVEGDVAIRVISTPEGQRLTAEFEVDEARCRHLLAAIPEGLFVHMERDDIRVTGRAGFDGNIVYTPGDPRSFRLRVGEAFPGTCQIVRMPRGFRPEVLLADDFRHVVSEEYTEERVVVGPGTESWVPMDTLPEYIPAIMHLTEQRRFYTDPAISPGLISRAIRINLMFERWAYGGSTVTQQLVKNLFLDRQKHLGRKLEEALIAWALEAILTKDQILELYMNCIEFGPDVYGIENAAQYYFNRHAHQLTPIQASYLAGLKPAPRSGASHRRRGRTPRRQRWQDRLQHHIQLLADRGYISQEYVDAQESFIIPLGEAVPPLIAPID